MILQIDTHSGVPVYRQLIDQIRYQVAAGTLLAGDALPSTRQLSVELGINPMTISKAYSLLEAEGLVERKRGQPCCIAEFAENSNSDQLRQEQLQQTLRPAAHAALQLGYSRQDALKAFEQILNEREHENLKEEQ